MFVQPELCRDLGCRPQRCQAVWFRRRKAFNVRFPAGRGRSSHRSCCKVRALAACSSATRKPCQRRRKRERWGRDRCQYEYGGGAFLKSSRRERTALSAADRWHGGASRRPAPRCGGRGTGYGPGCSSGWQLRPLLGFCRPSLDASTVGRAEPPQLCWRRECGPLRCCWRLVRCSAATEGGIGIFLSSPAGNGRQGGEVQHGLRRCGSWG